MGRPSRAALLAVALTLTAAPSGIVMAQSAGDRVVTQTVMEREAERGSWNIAREAAGLDASVIPWLRKRDVAAIGSKSALSVVQLPATTQRTNEDDHLPAHNFALVAPGASSTTPTLARWPAPPRSATGGSS